MPKAAEEQLLKHACPLTDEGEKGIYVQDLNKSNPTGGATS